MVSTADASLILTLDGQAYDLGAVPLPAVFRDRDGAVRATVSSVEGADGREVVGIVPAACGCRDQEQRLEFQSLVAHELRSPLAVIQGYAGLLATGLAGSLNEDQREFVQGIDTKVEELVRLLDDYLDFQRLDAGVLALRPQPVALAELVEQVVDEYRRRAIGRGLTLTCDLPAVGMELEADPLRLRQILDNLLSNAVKHATEGTWVRIGGRELGPDVELVVADGGPELPADELASLFQPYLRGNLAQRSLGAGLGLLVVERLVAEHGGQIEASCPPGSGLRFVVTLPRVAVRGSAGA